MGNATVVKNHGSQVWLLFPETYLQENVHKNVAMDHQNLRPFAILSFSDLPLMCCILQKESATCSVAASSRSSSLAGEPSDPAPDTYCERSVLRAGRGRALLSMRLRAPVERQIVLAGLACIVLSVWHPVLCGNPVLWGWRKWDCGEWLHHCIRSCCWLLVTLEKGESRRQLYYTAAGRWKHHPEKLSTNSPCQHPTHRRCNTAPSAVIFSIKRSTPRSSEL